MIINENIDHGRHRKGGPDSRFFKIRNLLNALFMLLAIIGVAVYALSSHTTGTIIVLVAMVFKFIECCLRIIR